MQGTYCEGMRAHVRPDGRIHGSILPDGARSGRTSMADPNLQNLPRESDSPEGKLARDVFAAKPGWLFVHVDYRQLEYMVAAMLSQDPEMIALARSGVDFHLGTAQLVAPIMRWPEVTKTQRSIAKQLNFALIFGLSDSALANRLDSTMAMAARVRAAVLGKFQVFDAWAKRQIREVKLNGYTRTYWAGRPARWRPMWRIASEEGEARSRAEHGAINTPIQGTAAEFCNRSISSVVDWIEEDCVPAELVLAIHDALLLHVREDAVDEVATVVPRLMLQWDSMGVPLGVDVEVGHSFGSLRKYEARA
jgi:DNA polymerase I